MTITNVHGYAVACGRISASISPAQGDTRITAALLREDTATNDEGLEIDIGLRRLLKGSSKYHVIIVTDSGFTFWPGMKTDEELGLTCLQTFCEENQIIFLHPPGNNPKQVLMNGMFNCL